MRWGLLVAQFLGRPWPELGGKTTKRDVKEPRLPSQVRRKRRKISQLWNSV